MKEGDKIAYMAKAFANTCQCFKTGTVTQITEGIAFFENRMLPEKTLPKGVGVLTESLLYDFEKNREVNDNETTPRYNPDKSV